MIENKRYQILYVELSDGRTGTFMGPELVTEEDFKVGVIARYCFGPGKKLPDDCYFEFLQEEKEND